MISNNRVEWAALYYATMSLGAAFVPMYEAQLPEIWAYIVRDSGAKVVIAASETIYTQISTYPSAIPTVKHILAIGSADASHSFEQLVARGRAQPVPPVLPNEQDLAVIIYTSGTTGEPKGVQLSHGNLTSQLHTIRQIVNTRSPPMYSSEDRSVSFLPWSHVYGQTCELNGMILAGASIAIAEHVTLCSSRALVACACVCLATYGFARRRAFFLCLFLLPLSLAWPFLQ